MESRPTSGKARSTRQAFDEKIAQIEALISAPEEDAKEQLRKALKDRNNFLIAKAATVIARRELRVLIPEVLDTFDRLMEDPVKSDTQCWGKNAIAKTLKDLGHSSPGVFLRGAAHIQMEPTYGGRVDTAVTLRGTCAHALVGCKIDTLEILTWLTGLLADPQAPVRIDAAQAIGQLSAKEGTLPLRLKALVGDKESEVIGHCLASLLNLGSDDALKFVASFLHHPDEALRMEAAAVLTGSRDPEALEHVKKFWHGLADRESKEQLLSLLAGSPLSAAAEFLLSIAEESQGPIAREALKALKDSRYHSQFEERISVLTQRHGAVDS